MTRQNRATFENPCCPSSAVAYINTRNPPHFFENFLLEVPQRRSRKGQMPRLRGYTIYANLDALNLSESREGRP